MAAGPGTDADANAETMPRRSRAERRREGLLPAGEDPLLRRRQEAPPRPAAGPPPGGGRRWSDQAEADLPVPPGPGVPTTARPAVGRSAADRAADVPPGSLTPSPRLHDSGPQPLVRAGRASWPVQTRQDRSAPAPSRAAGRTRPGPPTPSPDRRPSPSATGSPWIAGPLTSLAPVAGPPPAPLTSPAPVTGPPSGPATVFDPISAPPVSPRTGERPTPGPSRRPVDGARSGSSSVQVATPVAAPATDAIRHDAPRGDAPPRVPGPASGPVGGRAAARLERQAAEAAARRNGRRGSTAAAASGLPRRTPDAPRGTEPAGAPRRAVQLVLAMVVVALVVLGVWSFTIPRAQEASGSRAATSEQAAATDPSPGSPADAPAQVPGEAEPPADAAAEVVPVEPARAPVTVVNSTRITGLAADIAGQLAAGGWETREPATSEVADIAITTVFYTEGDAGQQAAAAELVAQFPDLSGPVARFFEVPGVADPGLVVVATGNWTP
ncbi:MAG TPA: LytR C-terminal domain-containing protein [Modestobacter sp.]|nr:LytR C-terminal domain-containing protein [Modestobacter sp.]